MFDASRKSEAFGPSSRERTGELVVETHGLTKRYGKDLVAVNDLDLAVRRGEVYGFLGPNGAGKSTTLRMLLGLVEPNSGTVRVLGQELDPPARLSGVGALVESPAFYPYLSGRDNLRVMARYSGGVPMGRIGEVLEKVGLAERAKDKFKKYSLGMKQRLAVAAALLGDPDLLILDEPTNGLDPKGMAEMRALIREFGSGGRTVLLSSHLLREVEQVCDRVGVIRDGSLVAEGPVEEFRGGNELYLRAAPVGRALELARGVPGVEEAEAGDGAIRLVADPELAPEVVQRLLSGGVRVEEIKPGPRTLEDVFLELTTEKG